MKQDPYRRGQRGQSVNSSGVLEMRGHASLNHAMASRLCKKSRTCRPDILLLDSICLGSTVSARSKGSARIRSSARCRIGVTATRCRVIAIES